MKTKEINAKALEIVNKTNSAKEIKGYYAQMKEAYGTEAAKAIIDRAREIRAGYVAKVTEERETAISVIDEKALSWEFEGLKKDKAYKVLANRAACKCANVAELVAKWYPHTIDGVPAMKKANEDGTKVWVKKAKINPSATLKACLRQMAKFAKGVKSGTTKHEEGELA